MPEYLAPGVYVEETSFRAKSIEGVSTSTTGFAGLTRKGPTEGTPELITSFGDFERIYGGFADLELGGRKVLNYLAHAVRAYFDNGGSRLYVARVHTAATEASRASSPWTGDGGDDKDKVRFAARYPGQVGNGRVTVRLVGTPATGRGMAGAPEGTVLRVRTVLAEPARLQGGKPPFALQDKQTLELKDLVKIDFLGQPAEVVGTADLADPIDLDAGEELEVDLGSGPVTVPLPDGSTSHADLLAALNPALQPAGGEAAITGNRLVLRSLRRGSSASIEVKANSTFGFSPADGNLEAKNKADAANNVADLSKVTVEEVRALLGSKVSTGVMDDKLVLSSKETGSSQALEVTAASTATGLGFAAGEQKGVTGEEEVYVKTGGEWKGAGGSTLNTDGLVPTEQPGEGAELVTANVLTVDADGDPKFYEDLGLAPGHPRYAGSILGPAPGRRIDALENLFALELGESVKPLRLLQVLTPANGDGVSFQLAGGSDGGEPGGSDYEKALDALGRIENISIVAAPGHSAFAATFLAIQGELIQHVERRRAYRVAVLDTPPDQTVGQAVETRSKIDSTRAALYYPWVVTDNPMIRPGDETVAREIALPPSGFVCGIYARNDVERSVAKAPANEVVRGALRFESDVNFAEQEVLNPAGVNCLRFFPGRGYRVWGARTASSDPEWKYVNVRRYFLYLEHSIDRGTQWAVFENNGERLWANVRETIDSFLYGEWRSGDLLGGTPAEAYFVRCDRSTMTQNDLDNGRLICLIGVAVLKPAEFVIFRIGQKTADART